MAKNNWRPYQGETLKPLRKPAKRTYPERDLVHLPLMKRAMLHPLCKEYLMHIANERETTYQQGMILKAMGVMRGASDLFLAVPNRRFAGYWIELKAPDKKPTPVQYDFLARMEKIGYATGWFDSWEKAWESIENYLSEIRCV